MALRGALCRVEGRFRQEITLAWLVGQLAQCDLKNYPALDSLIGDQPKKPEAADPAELAANARAWGAWLNAENKRAERRVSAPQT